MFPALGRARFAKRLTPPPSDYRNKPQANDTCCGNKRPDACCREARIMMGLSSLLIGGREKVSMWEGSHTRHRCGNMIMLGTINFLPPNVSCDDTELPARSSIGPLSLPRPVVWLRSTTFDFSKSTVAGNWGMTIRYLRDVISGCEVRIDWRARP